MAKRWSQPLTSVSNAFNVINACNVNLNTYSLRFTQVKDVKFVELRLGSRVCISHLPPVIRCHFTNSARVSNDQPQTFSINTVIFHCCLLLQFKIYQNGIAFPLILVSIFTGRVKARIKTRLKRVLNLS